MGSVRSWSNRTRSEIIHTYGTRCDSAVVMVGTQGTRWDPYGVGAIGLYRRLFTHMKRGAILPWFWSARDIILTELVFRDTAVVSVGT